MYFDLEALEFSEIIKILKSFAKTNYAKEHMDDLTPCNDLEEVLELNLETKEAYQAIVKLSDIPLGGLYSVKGSLERARIGGCLEAHELLNIVGLMDCVNQVLKYFKSLEGNKITITALKKYIEKLSLFPALRTSITLAIDTDGNVCDNASKELFTIRRNIISYQNRIRSKLTELLTSKASMLTENLIVMKNNRMCLPVKIEHKNTFKGILHDISSSNTTCYIEPEATISLANQIDGFYSMEKKEIQNILMNLSLMVGAEVEGLQSSLEALTALDVIFAKAMMAYRLDYQEVNITKDQSFYLHQARHPLIDKDKVVPIDVELGKKYNAIIITGPNTGGKTVALKTIGLLHAMMMCGMFVPCKSDSTLSVFSEILVDIGDEQSIAQSLSTFSAHMKKMNEIIHNSSFESLILLDELGSGTDPKEGSSLAIAMIDHLKRRGAKLIVTTHYSDLKSYAYREEDICNASVEFDSNTLKPTYRLLIGVPGKSNAIEIAARLGVPDSIIAESRAYMQGLDTSESSKLMETMEEEIRQMRIQEQELAHKIDMNDRIHQELALEKLKLSQQKDKIMDSAKQEAKAIIEKTSEEAKQLLENLRLQMTGNYKEHEIAKLKHQLKTLGTQQEEESLFEEPLEVGDYVLIKAYDQYGTITKIKKDRFTVQMGQYSMDFSKSDLVKSPKPKEKVQKQSRMSGYHPQAHISLSLDLRGKRYEEVKELMDSYLDQAILANLEMVSIIHGFGTGAIRKAVWEYLKQCPFAKSYRYGGEGEGLNGVTIVKLK